MRDATVRLRTVLQMSTPNEKQAVSATGQRPFQEAHTKMFEKRLTLPAFSRVYIYAAVAYSGCLWCSGLRWLIALGGSALS